MGPSRILNQFQLIKIVCYQDFPLCQTFDSWRVVKIYNQIMLALQSLLINSAQYGDKSPPSRDIAFQSSFFLRSAAVAQK